MDPALNVVLKLFGVFALVLANGFFVSAEFALVTVRRHRLKVLAEAGRRAAQAALRLTESPTVFISVTQFGVTVSSLAIGYLGEETFARLLESALLGLHFNAFTSRVSAHAIAIPIAFASITFLHVVIGEIVPKTAALERSEATALMASIPIEIIYKIFWPFIWLLNNSGQLLIRTMGLKSTLQHTMAYTEDEIGRA